MKFTTACLAILLTLPISASIGQESQAQGKAVEAAPDSATAAWADSLPRIGMLDAIVVTASRTAQRMKDAPAAVTVFDEQKVRDLPATYYTDYMRMAAGVNAVEFSAGDQSINPRSAAGTIPLGLLTLVDNRAVYNDFNGQTFWNSFQIDPSEIKQIEVLRGPSSVVWGANALDGVVNIITKSPREMQGTYLKLGGGSVSGQDAQDTGGIFNAALTHAGARGKFGYKLSGSYLKQEAYPRPTGTIPGTGGPGNPFPGGATPYLQYENQGSEQLRGNVRFDYDRNENTTWSLSGGGAGFTGLLATPGGPATLDEGTNTAFVKADWSHKSMRATVYANFLAGMGRFVLAPPGFGEYNQHDQTYEAFFTDSRLVGNRHLLSYGVSARYAVYDMINATNRGSGGVYLQDDIRLSEKFRGVIGARVDYVERMGSTVSPRVSLLFSPGSGNTFRASYNRAFQAPTAIQNFFLNQGVRDIPISYADSTYLVSFPVLTTGNPDLEEVKLDNFEIGWVGQFVERVEASASVYWNQRRNAIVGNQAVEVYTSSNPPPGWPADLPDSLLDGQYSGIPSVVTNDNVAQIDNLGVELAMSVRLGQPWTVFANYSWQDDSITEGIESVLLPNGQTVERINQPPAHRGNAGVFWDIHRFFANANVTAQSEAFWTDVRGPLYWGSTDSFAALNLGVGARVFEQQATVSVNVQNIFDDTVLQHVSSDIISRKVTAEITYRF